MKYNLEQGYLEYERSGEGIPLIFIHGYPLSRKIWSPQVKDLSDNASILTLDLRGHGESYPFAGPYPMDLLAEDCYSLLKAVNIKPPVVVFGLSMGGYITFALYRKYPDLFRGMILISTRPGQDSPEGKANREAGIRNVLEHGVPFIANGMLSKLVSPETMHTQPDLVESIQAIMLETSVNGVVGALQGMMLRPDSTPLLASIKCPVLIIHGEDDQLIPVKEAQMMAELIPDSRLVVVPKAGHLCNMEQPEPVYSAIRNFLSSLA